MTLIELMALVILCCLAFLFGSYGAKYAGWLAWIPAFVLGALAMWVAVASLIAEVRQQIATYREKLSKNK